MSILSKVKNGFLLQKESLTFAFKHPRLLLYWIFVTALWICTWFLFLSNKLSLKSIDAFLFVRDTIILIVWVACINHMKNIIVGSKTTVKNTLIKIRSMSLSILIIILFEKISSYIFETYVLSIHKNPETIAFYSFLKNLPIIKIIFWLPKAFTSLLLTIMIFENVHIIKAFIASFKVIFKYFIQILLWTVSLILIDLLVSVIFGFLILTLNIQPTFVASKIILITHSFVRFVFGLTFIVLLYNDYRKKQF